MKYCATVLSAALLAAFCCLLTACHTVGHATVTNADLLIGKKHVFVVVATAKDRGFLQEIRRNLTGRGFVVTSGPREQMGSETDLYVEYSDKWAWDLVMYPSRVRISIYSHATQALVGSAEFKNTAFHTFPDPPEITDELLGRIFGEPEGRYMK